MFISLRSLAQAEAYATGFNPVEPRNSYRLMQEVRQLSVYRGKHQRLNGRDDHVRRAVDLFAARETAQAEADRALCQILGQPHRAQHMGGLRMRGGTGGPCRRRT